jgi:hypothetical protein
MIPQNRIEFSSARMAIDHVRKAGSGVAIRLTGILVISAEDAHRLEASGTEFAYLHERQGRIIAVPVNGDSREAPG